MMSAKKTITYLEVAACLFAVIAVIAKRDYFSYKHCVSSASLSEEQLFLQKFPNSKYAPTIQGMVDKKEIEYVDTSFALQYQADKVAPYMREKYYKTIKEYDRLFPKGKLSEEIHAHIDAMHECDAYEHLRYKKNPLSSDYRAYLKKYPNGAHVEEVNEMLNNYNKQLRKEAAAARTQKANAEAAEKQKAAEKAAEKAAQTERYEKYKDNYLSNGSQPYAKYYGWNKTYTEYENRSGIKVKASPTSDVIVIAKRNNKYGPVEAHMYVRKGMTATMQIAPDATYQVFFYSGYGWDPEKKHGKVYGGFVSRENVQEDNPMFVKNLMVPYYILETATDGNLSLKTVNVEDAF